MQMVLVCFHDISQVLRAYLPIFFSGSKQLQKYALNLGSHKKYMRLSNH